jgi:hypothetical protein
MLTWLVELVSFNSFMSCTSLIKYCNFIYYKYTMSIEFPAYIFIIENKEKGT